MKIYRAFRTELDLNNKQRTRCIQFAGAARFVYNWGLQRRIDAYKNGQKMPTCYDLNNEITSLKKTQFPWLADLSKCVHQEPLVDLDQAYKNFFRRVKQKKAGKNIKVGFPKFKSRKFGIGSFRLRGAILITDNAIRLPRLGFLRLKERGYLPVEGVRILTATVTEKARRWFVSVQVEIEVPDPADNRNSVIGVDLGINTLATTSDGWLFDNPRALRQSIRKLKRRQRIVSRRQNNSNNSQKALQKLSRAYLRVANIRKDCLHKATSLLAKTKSVVVLEDLDVGELLQKRKRAQSIADVGFYEFRRKLTYKGSWYGCQVLIANRYYPSTKRCSFCGNIKQQMSLAERIYNCNICGVSIDRDLNAAKNLEQVYWSTVSSTGSNACGENISPA